MSTAVSYRFADALDLDSAEIAVLEEIADQPVRVCGDDDGVRLGQGLQPGGEVRRFARSAQAELMSAHLG